MSSSEVFVRIPPRDGEGAHLHMGLLAGARTLSVDSDLHTNSLQPTPALPSGSTSPPTPVIQRCTPIAGRSVLVASDTPHIRTRCSLAPSCTTSAALGVPRAPAHWPQAVLQDQAGQRVAVTRKLPGAQERRLMQTGWGRSSLSLRVGHHQRIPCILAWWLVRCRALCV